MTWMRVMRRDGYECRHYWLPLGLYRIRLLLLLLVHLPWHLAWQSITVITSVLYNNNEKIKQRLHLGINKYCVHEIGFFWLLVFFTARRCCRAVYARVLCLPVCLSIRPLSGYFCLNFLNRWTRRGPSVHFLYILADCNHSCLTRSELLSY